METAPKTTEERRLPIRYYCSAGFKYEITYVDPNSKGFAFKKYEPAITAKHIAFHQRLEELKQEHLECSGLKATAI